MPHYTLTLPEFLAMMESVGAPKALRAKVEAQATFVLEKRPAFTDADDRFEVASIYGHRTKEPRVNFKAGRVEHQLNVKKAQEIGQMLLVGAEAAISDAIVMQFLADKVGITDPHQQGAILLDLREFRQGSRGTVYPQ